MMERSGNGVPTTTDLLMCGNGQNGGLGNNIFTSSQGNPVRVKAMSGLQQCEHSFISLGDEAHSAVISHR